MDKFITAVGVIVIAVCLIAAFGLLWAFPIKWTWNYLMAGVFGLPTLTWGQAWCLYFLAANLIRGHPNFSKTGSQK